MRAELRHIHSPDAADLASYHPPDPECFQLFIQAMIGPVGAPGYESFDIIVCTPEAMKAEASKGPFLGLHRIIIDEWNFDKIVNLIRNYITRCEADTWEQLGQQLGQLGHWELEGYRES